MYRYDHVLSKSESRILIKKVNQGNVDFDTKRAMIRSVILFGIIFELFGAIATEPARERHSRLKTLYTVSILNSFTIQYRNSIKNRLCRTEVLNSNGTELF